ncbi:MAG: PIN/TRAM domain-containing protein [Candidatus Saccharimonadales bacterium]
MDQKILMGIAALNTLALGYIVWQLGAVRRQVKNQMVVDTSGLIDGRIVEIVNSGFIPQRIIIPQFVIAELQHLADQSDPFKRERARFGLEVVRRLQDMRQNEVVIMAAPFKRVKEVDDKLVALAKRYGALLYTTDFNLNQVAEIEGVRVLNVNELAQALRVAHLPGEKAEIKITQLGQDKTQGVGYLEDGTMVVVEQAAKWLGQKVEVEFSRILQTQAGKMMFAVPRHKHARVAHKHPAQKTHATKPQQKRSHSHSTKQADHGRKRRNPVDDLEDRIVRQTGRQE